MKVKDLIKYLKKLDNPNANLHIELVKIAENEDEPYAVAYEIEPHIIKEKNGEYTLQAR